MLRGTPMTRRRELRELKDQIAHLQRVVDYQTQLILRSQDRVLLYLDRILDGPDGVVKANPELSNEAWFRKYYPIVADRSRNNA